METPTTCVDDETPLFPPEHAKLNSMDLFAHHNGVDVLLLIIHPNLSILKRHENALHIFGLTHFHFLNVSDFSRHLFRVVHATFVVERVQVLIHGAYNYRFIQLDKPQWF